MRDVVEVHTLPWSTLIKLWVFAALFLPLTISLGFWQLDRAAQKEALAAERQTLWQQDILELTDFTQSLERFRPVAIKGRYLDIQILLDNRHREGRVGYEVYTPFKTVWGDTLLVNRGWVEAPAYRTELPDLATPEMHSEIALSGYFYWPEQSPEAAEHNRERLSESVWRIQVIDWAELQDELRETGLISEEFRLYEDEPGALNVAWPYQEAGPEKHKGYAFQWFAMATALLVLVVWASVRVVRERS